MRSPGISPGWWKKEDARLLPKPREEGTAGNGYSDQVADAVKTLGQAMEYWYADPQRAVEVQARLATDHENAAAV
jgi:hypothetical protein